MSKVPEKVSGSRMGALEGGAPSQDLAYLEGFGPREILTLQTFSACFKTTHTILVIPSTRKPNPMLENNQLAIQR